MHFSENKNEYKAEKFWNIKPKRADIKLRITNKNINKMLKKQKINLLFFFLRFTT